MIRATNIDFSYGDGPVFDRVSFLVPKNAKVALVGPNGAGKSTLFRILTQVEQISGGNIEVEGNIEFVPQEVKRDEKLEKATSVREYVDPESRVEDFELNKLFAGLEMDNLDLSSLPSTLSGGQKTKLALARALISAPDILLLDEPTNFMDIAGKKFVMNFLANYPKTLLLVSHDIELLDKSIDKVLFINTQTKKIDDYTGNYTKFLHLKAEKEELMRKEHRVKSVHIKQLEEAILKGKAKSKKGARAKTVLKRRLAREREALPELPKELQGFRLNLPEPPRVGELPIKLENISKSYGTRQIVHNLSFAVRRGEKFLLVGPNGSGKSTIIKILMGVLPADSGSVVPGLNLQAGYYSQEFETFDLTAQVIEFFVEKTNSEHFAAIAYLKKFMFYETKQKQSIGTLSGGEKTRLSMALLMAKNHNLLVLDEPTTYLDPLSQKIVLEAIKQYQGTLILVSHVPEFVQEIAPNRALIMPDARLVLWDDNYLDTISEV